MRCRGYPQTRDYENLQRAMFVGVGPFGIPEVEPVDKPSERTRWISFNFVRGDDDPRWHGVHFFIDDRQVARLWGAPDVYTEKLLKYQVVCTPDLSISPDLPLPVRRFNHYRKHWLGAYWQTQGMNVVSTVRWGPDPESWEWCFDGEPVGSCIALNGMDARNPETREAFLAGYRVMKKRLKPTHILLYGEPPDELKADRSKITVIPASMNRWLGAI